jgi:hypothetical protein
MMEKKIYNFKILKKEFIFWKKKLIDFVNVETDPRLLLGHIYFTFRK